MATVFAWLTTAAQQWSAAIGRAGRWRGIRRSRWRLV